MFADGAADARLQEAFGDSGRILAGLQLPTHVPVWSVPAPLQGFVNRTEIVAEVRKLAESDRSGPAVVAVHGRAGSGKTALLHRCAAAVRDLFDTAVTVEFGQLAPGGGAAMADVLGGVLQDLWIDDKLIPSDLRGRHRRFLAVTERRRVLVLIDGASEAAHVSLLTPNSPHALVIAAGDIRLDELSADGAQLHLLSGLDTEHGLKLLTAILGSDRVIAGLDDARKLVELCSGSPLGLRIAGARLRAQLELPLSRLITELESRSADATPRPSRPSAWSRLTNIFDSTYRWLDDEAAELYRSLGSAPGDRWPGSMIVAMMAGSGQDIDATLAELVRLDLVGEIEGGYALPALVRIHAREASLSADLPAVRDERRARMVRAWRSAAVAADRTVTRDRFRVTPDDLDVSSYDVLTSAQQAMDWFDRWHLPLLEVMREAAAQGLDEEVWQIFEATWPFRTSSSFFQEWTEAGTLAVDAARRSNNRPAEARMRCLLSRAELEQGNFDDAAADIHTALGLATGANDPALIASVLDFEGQLLYRRGEYARALTSFDRSLALNETLGDRRGIALQSQFRGRCLTRRGEYDAALDAFDRASDLIAAFADHRAESRILFSRAEALHAIGRPDAAAAALNDALARAVSLGTTDLVIPPLEFLAQLANEAGDSAAETKYLQRLRAALAHAGSPELQRVESRLASLAD